MTIHFAELSLSFAFSDIILPNFIENLDLENEINAKNIKEILIFCRDFLQKKESYLLHTSGSTGTPKPITISYNQICESIKMTQKALNLTQKDVFCVCLPTEFIAGKMMIARALYLGCEMWIYTPSTKFLDNFILNNNTKFSFIALVPPQLQYILSQENQTKILDNCKNIIVGGASVSVFLRNEILEKLKNAHVFLTYGMTETVSHIALQKLNFFKVLPSKYPLSFGEGQGGEVDLGEVFHTLNNVEIAICNEDSPQKNCLKIKSPTTNYEWITTNDCVELLSPTAFRLLGRVDNVVNIGGKKMQLEEIEAQFEKFFVNNYLENLVFYTKTKQDDIWGQSIVLVLAWENLLECKKQFLAVFPCFLDYFEKKMKFLEIENQSEKLDILDKKDILFGEIILILQQNIPKYMLPQSIEILTKFEKTVTMKLKKK